MSLGGPFVIVFASLLVIDCRRVSGGASSAKRSLLAVFQGCLGAELRWRQRNEVSSRRVKERTDLFLWILFHFSALLAEEKKSHATRRRPK